MKCFDCGEDGHIAANCRNREIDATGKPPWCGICDEESRLLDLGDSMAYCQVCHPKRHRQLRQHRKCPSCHMTVHSWDHSPCGSHSSPAITADQRPDREHIDAIIASQSGGGK